MKKIMWLALIITCMVSATYAAENFVMKRRFMAAKSVSAAAALVDACITAKQLEAERVSLGASNDFLDSDFTGIEGGQYLVHLSSYNVKVLLGTVFPDICAEYENVSLNKDILHKVRP